MKKIAHTLTALALLTSTVSCNKDEEQTPGTPLADTCRLVKMQNIANPSEVIEFEYLPSGKVSRIAIPTEMNGAPVELAYTYYYNPTEQLDSMTYAVGSSIQLRNQYHYANGLLHTVTIAGQAGIPSVYTYHYNSNNSIKEITHGNESEKFEYASSGNLTAVKYYYDSTLQSSFLLDNYDTKRNPFSELKGLVGFSENNLIYRLRNGKNNPGSARQIQHYQSGDIFDYSDTYTYTYNSNGLPDKMTITTLGGETTSLTLTYHCN